MIGGSDQQCLFKDFHKTCLSTCTLSLFNDLEFGGLIENQNHYIQLDHGFFQMNTKITCAIKISKDILNYNLPIFGRSSAATRQQIIAKIIFGQKLLQDLLAHKQHINNGPHVPISHLSHYGIKQSSSIMRQKNHRIPSY